MHCGWKKYPFTCQGLYKDHTEEYNVVLEAMKDYDMWIWQAFIDTMKSHNLALA
jgi:hypothetical protein